MTVNITGDFNLITFSRQVFGIDPADLEECALPTDDEVVGEFLTPAEQRSFVDARRAENGLQPLTDEEWGERDSDKGQ